MRKTSALLILAFTLLIVSSACDKPASAGAPPEILRVEPNQVTIAWESRSPYRGAVRFAAAGDATGATITTIEEQYGESQRHEVILQGLEPGTLYTYQIETYGPRYQFRTQPPSSSPFSFAVLSGNLEGTPPMLSPEVFDFIVHLGAETQVHQDPFSEFRSKVPVYDRLGPDSPYLKGEPNPARRSATSWRLDWGGLRLVFLEREDDLPAMLQSAAPVAFGIIASTDLVPPLNKLTNGNGALEECRLHKELKEYNTKNLHRPAAFVLVRGNAVRTLEADGIHYLEIPSQGEEDVALRVDVDVESIRAEWLTHQQEYILRQPPLGKQRTCDQCRRLADRGAYEESIDAYKDFIANNQGHFQVDDAVFSIAEIYDEKLFRFKDALSWYLRLVKDYPDGTLTPLAAQRINYLQKYNDFEFIPLERFERIRKQEFSRKGRQQSGRLKILGDAEAIVNDFPICRLAPVIGHWLANRYREVSVEKAVAAYRSLKKTYPDSPEANDVSFAIGETFYLAERYSEAINAFTDALGESPDKTKVIEGQIARSIRNIRRDVIAVACWALLGILLILALTAKPYGLRLAGAKKAATASVILASVLLFGGYLIHEQFDSSGKMILFAVFIALDAAIAFIVSSNIAAKLFDGAFWRAIVGSLLGLLFFATVFYLIVYCLNVHYLVLVKL